MFLANDTESGDFVFKIRFQSTSGRGERTPTVVTYEEDPNEQSEQEPVVEPETEETEEEPEPETPDPISEETEEEVIENNNGGQETIGDIDPDNGGQETIGDIDIGNQEVIGGFGDDVVEEVIDDIDEGEPDFPEDDPDLTDPDPDEDNFDFLNDVILDGDQGEDGEGEEGENDDSNTGQTIDGDSEVLTAFSAEYKAQLKANGFTDD